MPRTLTNKHGLHPAIYASMLDPTWYGGHGEDRFRSVTGLLKPPFMAALEDEHEDEIVEDAMDGIWKLMGSSMHGVVEKGATRIGIAEERMKMQVLGETITGGYDLLWEDNGRLILDDFKFTGVFTYIYGEKDRAAGKRSRLDEWGEQLQLYVLMLRTIGFNPQFARDTLIFRDWSKSKAEHDPDYPPASVIVPVPIWTQAEQMAFAEERVRLHKEAIAGNAEPCTPDERWQKPAKYAVMKPGNKKATKLCDTEDDAHAYIEYKGLPSTATVELRPGEDIRCNGYCAVCDWCPYFSEELPPF